MTKAGSVRNRRWIAAASVAILAGWGAALAGAQGAPSTQGVLPLGPQRERGASVTPAFEGWYANPDGSFNLLLGYYNRNSRETLDIPAGPNNKVEPGDPDQGQPTYFETGRQWGVFAIRVPKDFGTRSLTWTIVSNGEKQSIPVSLNKGYPITPFKELGMGNQPPVLSFSQGGPKVTGPPVGVSATFTGKVSEPVTISVWVEDPKGPDQEGAGGRGPSSVATVSFHKFRGPGKVTFDKARISVPKQGDMVSGAATFTAAGDYVLRVQANDESGEGGGGFQCCWTNAYVKVSIQ
jgi:hypothetical protein